MQPQITLYSRYFRINSIDSPANNHRHIQTYCEGRTMQVRWCSVSLIYIITLIASSSSSYQSVFIPSFCVNLLGILGV